MHFSCLVRPSVEDVDLPSYLQKDAIVIGAVQLKGEPRAGVLLFCERELLLKKRRPTERQAACRRCKEHHTENTRAVLLVSSA